MSTGHVHAEFSVPFAGVDPSKQQPYGVCAQGTGRSFSWHPSPLNPLAGVTPSSQHPKAVASQPNTIGQPSLFGPAAGV